MHRSLPTVGEWIKSGRIFDFVQIFNADLSSAQTSLIDRLLPFAKRKLPTTLPTLKVRYEPHPETAKRARALFFFCSLARAQRFPAILVVQTEGL